MVMMTLACIAVVGIPTDISWAQGNKVQKGQKSRKKVGDKTQRKKSKPDMGAAQHKLKGGPSRGGKKGAGSGKVNGTSKNPKGGTSRNGWSASFEPWNVDLSAQSNAKPAIKAEFGKFQVNGAKDGNCVIGTQTWANAAWLDNWVDVAIKPPYDGTIYNAGFWFAYAKESLPQADDTYVCAWVLCEKGGQWQSLGNECQGPFDLSAAAAPPPPPAPQPANDNGGGGGGTLFGQSLDGAGQQIVKALEKSCGTPLEKTLEECVKKKVGLDKFEQKLPQALDDLRNGARPYIQGFFQDVGGAISGIIDPVCAFAVGSLPKKTKESLAKKLHKVVDQNADKLNNKVGKLIDDKTAALLEKAKEELVPWVIEKIAGESGLGTQIAVAIVVSKINEFVAKQANVAKQKVKQMVKDDLIGEAKKMVGGLIDKCVNRSGKSGSLKVVKKGESCGQVATGGKKETTYCQQELVCTDPKGKTVDVFKATGTCK
jgi:hypothetical protein